MSQLSRRSCIAWLGHTHLAEALAPLHLESACPASDKLACDMPGSGNETMSTPHSRSAPLRRRKPPRALLLSAAATALQKPPTRAPQHWGWARRRTRAHCGASRAAAAWQRSTRRWPPGPGSAFHPCTHEPCIARACNSVSAQTSLVKRFSRLQLVIRFDEFCAGAGACDGGGQCRPAGCIRRS